MTESYATDIAERMLDDARFSRVGTGTVWTKPAGDVLMTARIIASDERIKITFTDKRGLEVTQDLSVGLHVPGAAILNAISTTEIWF
jgi:hypothetical protein